MAIRRTRHPVTTIDNELIDSTLFVNPLDKLLFICILRFEGEAFPNIEKLSKIVGIPEENVNAGISRLFDMGLIETDTNGNYIIG